MEMTSTTVSWFMISCVLANQGPPDRLIDFDDRRVPAFITAMRKSTGKTIIRVKIGGRLGVLSDAAGRRTMAILGDNEGVAQAIVKDPEIMHGTPVFRGTRVPLQTLFDYLEGGETLEDFLEGFPTVSRALALEALEEAKQLLLSRV